MGLFKPPEELSAAVAMELLYFYALAHQALTADSNPSSKPNSNPSPSPSPSPKPSSNPNLTPNPPDLL